MNRKSSMRVVTASGIGTLSVAAFALGIAAVVSFGTIGSSGDAVGTADSAPSRSGWQSNSRKTSDGARFDEPDAAIEYFWRKRQGPAPSHDPVAAYREALHRMDAMPRYSTTLGAILPDLPDIVSIDGNASFCYIIKAKNEMDQRRLPGAGRAQYGDGFSRFSNQVDVMKDRFVASPVVIKTNVFKPHLTLDLCR